MRGPRCDQQYTVTAEVLLANVVLLYTMHAPTAEHYTHEKQQDVSSLIAF
jgi:hypothetical protein